MHAQPLRHQRGQALVEALVLAAALLPFLLAVPLVAKYQDIRHAAIAAARTAAFECSIRPDACEDPSAEAAAAGDLRRRHFARHGRDLLSNDAPEEPAPPGERNRFWVDRRGAPLLARFDDVRLDVAAASSDAIAGAAARWNSGPFPAGPDAFGLSPEAGLATARVQASVSVGRSLAQWLDRPEGLQMNIDLQVNGEVFECDYVVTGVPHTVCRVDDLARLDVEKFGRLFRHHPAFAPRGVNANFVQVLGEGDIAVRTYEFGVEGETLACGTGSASAAIITALREKWGEDYRLGRKPVLVHARGGDVLRIFFTADQQDNIVDVCLETRVRLIYTGVLGPDMMQALEPGPESSS